MSKLTAAQTSRLKALKDAALVRQGLGRVTVNPDWVLELVAMVEALSKTKSPSPAVSAIASEVLRDGKADGDEALTLAASILAQSPAPEAAPEPDVA